MWSHTRVVLVISNPWWYIMRINITPYSERKRWIDGEKERGWRCKRVNSCCSVVAVRFLALAEERNSHNFIHNNASSYLFVPIFSLSFTAWTFKCRNLHKRKFYSLYGLPKPSVYMKPLSSSFQKKCACKDRFIMM